MSTRERWIVYPLLFLTLGSTLRHEFVGFREIRAEHLVCDRLESSQAEFRELRGEHLLCDRLESGQSECRKLLVKGPSGRPVVAAGADSQSGNGVIESFSVTGMPLVQIGSANAAGRVLVTGRVGENLRVFGQLPELDLGTPFGLPWRYEGNHTGKTPPEGQQKVAPPTKRPAAAPDKAAETKTGTNNKEKGK